MLKKFWAVLFVMSWSMSVCAQVLPKTLPPKKVPSPPSETEQRSIRSPSPIQTEVEVAKTGIRPLSPENPPSPGANPVDLNYPKLQMQIAYLPQQLKLKTEWQGESFTHSPRVSNPLALLIRHLSTPQDEAELEYFTSLAQSSSDTLASDALGNFALNESSTKIDSLMLRIRHFWFDQQDFFHRYGVGVEFGTQSFPTFQFSPGNELSFSKAKDLVAGVNFNYQRPLSPNLLFKARAGFDIGTGSVQSVDLKTKKSRLSYGILATSWSLDPYSTVELAYEYRSLIAEISGERAGNEEKWNSNATSQAARIGYTYTF